MVFTDGVHRKVHGLGRPQSGHGVGVDIFVCRYYKYQRLTRRCLAEVFEL